MVKFSAHIDWQKHNARRRGGDQPPLTADKTVLHRAKKERRRERTMGFFANIPKPPKLAGFFGDEEEENASDGTNTTEGREKEGKNMEEIGGVMEDLELEILIQLLATNKPLHHALRKWLKKNTDTPELDIKELINPHDRVDVSGFLLRRTRRISYAFSILKTQLERPYYSKATLKWRLHGPVGVMALSRAILKEAKSEEEKIFLLSELSLELSGLKIISINGTIEGEVVRSELKSLIKSIRNSARSIENKNKMIQEYATDAFKKALSDV